MCHNETGPGRATCLGEIGRKENCLTTLHALFLATFVGLISLQAFGQRPEVEKVTVPFESLRSFVKAELFQPDFPEGDCNYNAIVAASDGKIHFVIGTHHRDYACRYYTFDPRAEMVTLVARLDEALGEDARRQISQGKIHTPLFEHKGKIWFATHTSFYEDGLPGRDSGDKSPYGGGHLMNYDLETGQFTDLARVMPSEGIITLAIDPPHEMLYGLTWPSGILVSYSIPRKELRCWGAVQGRGEWGLSPREWDRICRNLAVDPQGNVYGSTMGGLIWKFDPRQLNPVSYVEGLDLSQVPFSQSAQETMKGDFHHNWRVIQWNPKTSSFWGLHFETTTLFEFIPSVNYIRAVAELRPEPYQGMPRNPEISQLGFTIAPKNTIFYLAHGPAVEMEDRPPVQSAVHLIIYRIDQKKLINHGPILSADKRRVFFSESIAIGPDDRIYTVAWVEITDPKRKAAVGKARAYGPAETEKMVYEILLVRLPRWQQFVHNSAD